MKKKFSILATLCMSMGLCMVLWGCSSEPKLSDSDVVGTWNLTQMTGDSAGSSAEELNANGLYVLYRFDDDHTFHMIGLVQGTETVRDGSWEITDDAVKINVEADNSGSLKADAIEDGVVEISGSTLETDSIGGGHVEAEKVSDDQVAKIYEQSKSFGPKQVSLGEKVSGDGYTFTLTSFDFKDEIYPSDNSGYYSYYQDESGKTYLCARANLTNDSFDYAGFCKSTSAEFNVGGNKYSASVEQDINRGFWSMYTLDAKDTGSYIIYASIPDSVKDSSDITLTWSFPQSASRLQSYFSSSLDNVSYCLKK